MHNTFEYININEMNKIDECYANGNGNNRKIRPTTYKTFLKVKSLDKVCKLILFVFNRMVYPYYIFFSVDTFQFQNNKASKQGLFVIEWIPNTLPISKYGEMIIKLKFGHMKNDKICYKKLN